jgi:hypothetical protein
MDSAVVHCPPLKPSILTAIAVPGSIIAHRLQRIFRIGEGLAANQPEPAKMGRAGVGNAVCAGCLKIRFELFRSTQWCSFIAQSDQWIGFRRLSRRGIANHAAAVQRRIDNLIISPEVRLTTPSRKFNM